MRIVRHIKVRSGLNPYDPELDTVSVQTLRRSLRTVRVHDLSVPGNLSRVSWKLSRTVLRGGTNSNVGPLLGQRRGKAKQPFCFEVGDGGLFAFAGLWERWRDPSGQWVKSCSILTTTPNAVTSAIHDRMPVILDPDSYDLWLDPGMTECGGDLRIVEAIRCR